jgi:S1-C subfamily serine protease
LFTVNECLNPGSHYKEFKDKVAGRYDLSSDGGGGFVGNPKALSFGFSIALVGLTSSFQLHAQSRDTAWATIPALGVSTHSQNPDEGTPLDGPLPEGMSFQTLRDLIKAMAQEKTSLRGAREIAIFRQAAPAVVLIRTKEGSGSGVVLQTGQVLTNRHVVKGIGRVSIFFKPNDLTQSTEAAEARVGTVQFVDPERDLALISPESLPSNSRFLKIAIRDDIEVGADVFAIGHPLGYSWTFTQGIVSGVRPINADGERYTAIQTQTPINPGNSGGPLLNPNLEVVGINTWVRDISNVEREQVSGQEVTITRPAQGLNFAVSAHDVRGFIDDATNGKLNNLGLSLPSAPQGCSSPLVFNGRTKANDAGLKAFSLRCDAQADAWEIFPDDQSKPVEFHFDPDRTGKSSIVVFSDVARNSWYVSYWDFFLDGTFAVIGRHEDGKLRPTRFEFARS